MPNDPLINYNVRYGNTLPPVCNPQSGDVFFLTADTGEGRGVYISTAINTWKRLGLGGSGTSLPPAGTDGDIFVVTSGPNIGIYQYYSATWNIVGGGPGITPGPTTFTDFSNAALWIPIGSVDVTRTLATSGMTLAGATARSVNSGFCGVQALFQVFPDPLNGNMEFSVTFDNYVRSTDLLNNDEFRYGMMWFPGGQRDNNDTYCGVAYGGLSGAGQDFFALEEISETTGGAGWVGLAIYTTAIPAASTFTLLAQSLRMVWSGNNDHGFRNVTCTMDGGGGPLGGLINQVNSALTGPSGIAGIRPFIGCWFNATSNTISARATSFTVTQGQVVSPL